MATIEMADALKSLRSERTRTRKKLRQLEKAIAVLRGLSTNSTPTRNGRRRRMSASARRKIAEAQRKRWAKFHRQRA